ncbi:MAG: hypothetical protein HQL99_10800 [Magnetococcales bacterium]|nr:hypothetical protein [Magnetococcales bacterium]
MNQAIIDSICRTTADYRADEGLQPTPDRIIRWVSQFDEEVREDLLLELDYVFKQTYLSKDATINFLKRVVFSNKLTEQSPESFWNNAVLLDIQTNSQSQKHMIGMIDDLLSNELNVRSTHSGSASSTFVYIDDGLFSGNRILRDLSQWITDCSPDVATVHVVVLVIHSNGLHYANKKLTTLIEQSSKAVNLKWWKLIKIQDPYNFTEDADVLRPKALPSSPDVVEYVNYLAKLNFSPVMRSKGDIGPLKLFSTEKNRILLEEQLLISGARLRAKHQNLPEVARPLGFSILKTLGFGSMMVTYRNCPNNCPLAFWVEDDDFPPLFPRRTNQPIFNFSAKTNIKDLFGLL